MTIHNPARRPARCLAAVLGTLAFTTPDAAAAHDAAMSADEVRAVVARMLADADTRTSLQGSAVAGHNGSRFFLSSEDGDFMLKLYGAIQFRYVAGFRESDSAGDEFDGGFEVTRTRLGFSGHVYDPSIKYFILGGFGSSGTSFVLDAWVAKALDEHWTLRAGQFKTPVDREFLMSETRQQFVERSVLNARFGAGYTQGLALEYEDEAFRAKLSFNDGARSGSVASGESSFGRRWAATARLEYKLDGDWSEYSDFCNMDRETPDFTVGGAVHYQNEEVDDTSSSIFRDGTEILQLTGDVSFETGGFGFAAIGHYRQLENDDTDLDADEWGVLLQAGYMITDDFEVAARFEYGDLDGQGEINDELSLLTVGATKFLYGHAAKLQADLGVAFEAVDPLWGGSGRGWRGDAAGDDNQVVFRLQYQLLF